MRKPIVRTVGFLFGDEGSSTAHCCRLSTTHRSLPWVGCCCTCQHRNLSVTAILPPSAHQSSLVQCLCFMTTGMVDLKLGKVLCEKLQVTAPIFQKDYYVFFGAGQASEDHFGAITIVDEQED